MKKTLTTAAAVCFTTALLFSAGSPSHGDSSFTTQDLNRSAMSEDCLDWRVDGICFWLQCSLFGCRIVTSIRVSHRLPDLVVQSYIEPGEPPWIEWQPRSAAAAKSAHPASQPATGMTGATNRNRFSNMLNYFETDVVGSPAAVLDSLGSGRFMCRTDVTPFHPYLSASADAEAWRGTADNRRVPTLKDQGEVGLSPDNTWGPLRPRTGFVLQPHPAKAAAVTATRGVDIVTRDPEGHVATPYRNSHSARRMLRGDPEAPDPKTCSDSGGVWKETKNETGCRPAVWRQWRSPPAGQQPRWQMLTPEPTRQCRRFGTLTPPSAAAEDGRYGWHYWQRYRCCRKRGIFIGETGL